MARLFDDAQSQDLENGGAVCSAPPMTLACWFRTDDPALDQELLCIGDANTDLEWFDLQAAAGHAGDPVRASVNGTYAATTTGLNANVWHHAAATFLVTGPNIDYAVYIDGGSPGSTTKSATPTPNRTTIGARVRGASRDQSFSGRIAEVAIYKVILSTTDIAALAAGVCPLLVRPGELVAYLPLGGIYGRHDRDLVGDYHMTAYGGPTWAEHPLGLYYPDETAVGIPGGAAGPNLPVFDHHYRAMRAA